MTKIEQSTGLKDAGCKGQARPCSRSIGDYDGVHPIRTGLVDGVQGRAKSPCGHGGVGGAGTLHLTGDATAIRCTGFDDLPHTLPCLHRRHQGKRMEIRRCRFAGGDATGHAQRVPLAKVAMVVPSTPSDAAIFAAANCQGRLLRWLFRDCCLAVAGGCICARCTCR